MKVAVVGTGKSGHHLLELIPKEQIVGPFNSRTPPTAQALQSADVIILFVPGAAVGNLLETIIASKRPAVWASTGFTWPDSLNEQLKENELVWVASPNFSLAMTLIEPMLGVLAKAPSLLKSSTFSLHEIHHAKKTDGPSGTALQWQKWLKQPVDISFSRQGDHVGTHTLKLSTPHETITLQHVAHNRRLFAQGALWAAEQITFNRPATSGLYSLQQLVTQQLKETVT